MSRKERDRLVVMAQVKHRKLSLSQASGVLGLSYRQTRRIWRRFLLRGDAGLVHGLRGRPSSRRKAPRLRARILECYRDQYGDFGPTLAAEYLRRQDGLKVDHETLRRLSAFVHRCDERGQIATRRALRDMTTRVEGRTVAWTVK